MKKSLENNQQLPTIEIIGVKENYTSIFTGDDYKISFTEVDEELVKEITNKVSESLKDNSIKIDEEFLNLLVEDILYDNSNNKEEWINEIGSEAFDFIEDCIVSYNDEELKEDELVEELINEVTEVVIAKSDIDKSIIRLIVKEIIYDEFNKENWISQVSIEALNFIEGCTNICINCGSINLVEA